MHRNQRQYPRSALRRIALAVVVLLCVEGVLASAGGAATKAKAKTTKAASKTAAKKPKVTLGALRKTKAERDAVRRKKAKAAAKLNALKLSRKKAAESLAVINSNVRATGIALDRAKRSSASAKKQLAQTEERLRGLEKQLSYLQSSQLTSALRAYASPSAGSMDSLLLSDSSSEAGRWQILDDLAKRNQADQIDALRSLREDVDLERGRAEAARERAIARQRSVANRLADFEDARKDQAKFAQSLEDRLERELSESAALAELDSVLSKRLQSQNDALARQLASAGIGARGGGKYSIGSVKEIAGVGGGGDTHGIRVAPSIRGQLAAMLRAAKNDGIYLTGGGYRSPANQIRLRAAHCGSSSYAIYQMRSSQCRPPTARPGNSMHERGLAIDFTEGRGQGALTRRSRGYAWLRANAWRYGFKNLPSEPWHWSINGR